MKYFVIVLMQIILIQFASGMRIFLSRALRNHQQQYADSSDDCSALSSYVHNDDEDDDYAKEQATNEWQSKESLEFDSDEMKPKRLYSEEFEEPLDQDEEKYSLNRQSDDTIEFLQQSGERDDNVYKPKLFDKELIEQLKLNSTTTVQPI